MCDLDNIPDDCYDLLAGWYRSPNGYFIHFSGRDTKQLLEIPQCGEKITEPEALTDYRLGLASKREITHADFSLDLVWDGTSKLTATEQGRHGGLTKSGTYTRRADLAKVVTPPSYGSDICTP